ncbi:MAG: hypothetical protein GY738_24015, partial [Pseudoalteromonas sp.]|nr:hypothetical protein [Pseudoalteromonas sp.]
MTANLVKGKTEHMVFGAGQNLNFNLRFGPHVVRCTKTYKYLGVVLEASDTSLKMQAQQRKTLRSAYGAHNAVAQLQVAAPDMPLGTIGSIWQTWVLPQLCYAVGVWGNSTNTGVAEKFTHMCGRMLLGAPHNTAAAIVQAEMGWRSLRFWVRYHQCRTLSRLLRAPTDDLLHTVLIDQLSMLRSEPEQSWMQPVLDELTESGFAGAAHLRQWVRVTLPTLNLARHDEIKATMDVMRFEDAWAGTVLHDEHAEWQAEVHLGPTREHYADHVSERRDRKAGLRVKPRWATIMRPSRSMRHLIGKADAKLLSETRMGSKRSLTAHTNPHRHTIGTACPACGQQDDPASYMLKSDAIMQGI